MGPSRPATNVATAKANAGNSHYGLSIGLVVVAGAFTAGPISGGAFNPAVSIALVVIGALKAADLWIHLAGQLVGAVFAALAFKALVKADA